MSELKLSETIKYRAIAGGNALSASTRPQDVYYSLDPDYAEDVDKLVRLVSAPGGSVADRTRLFAAVVGPIMQVIPYVSLYDRFFMPKTAEHLEDALVAVEDIINLAYGTDLQSGILYNGAGYQFVRPTFQTFNTGAKWSWYLVEKAGWDVVARTLQYVTWELARKRDAASKTVVDNAIPTGHKLTVSGGVTKSAVDEVVRRSAEIGFPVTQAVVNPGRIMEMQSWTWVMPNIPQGVAQALIDNFYYGNYGGVNWFVNPNASSSIIYFGGSPEQIGWHWTKGAGRTDRASDIDNAEDRLAVRDAEHSWYAQSGLSLWTVTIA